jgi:hypothetical protein
MQKDVQTNIIGVVLFTDEVTVTNHKVLIYTLCTMGQWREFVHQVEHQYQWSFNVRCGILGNEINDPHFIDGILYGFAVIFDKHVTIITGRITNKCPSNIMVPA